MSKRITNKDIDKRLNGRNIKRLESYVNNKKKILWKCLVKDCQYEWKTAAGNILNDNTGCPKCAGSLKLNNDYIDKLINGRQIKRLDYYINTNTPINFVCLVDGCNYSWKTTPNSIIYKNSGCPKCSGKLLLTVHIIDERLKNRPLKIIGNYINNSTPTSFICLNEECKYIWKARPADILTKKSGCPKCAGLIQYTNEFIDDKLKQEGLVKRIGNCINSKEKIKFLCLIDECNYEWYAQPHSIVMNKSGCPKCAGLCPITNEYIDNFLKDKNIKRVDDIINSRTKITFKCLINDCQYIWLTTTNSILNGHGCHKCSKQIKFTNEILDDRLEGRKIKRIGNCINSSNKILFQCLKENCNFEWMASPNSIVNSNKTGCPNCAGQARLTNNKIDEILKYRNISRLDNYSNLHTKIHWLCMECNNKWLATPANIIHNKSGCPICAHTIISIPEIQWLDSLNIPKECRQITIKVGSRIFKVDGRDPNNPNILYELNGDYWHGNPELYDPNDINRNNKKTFGELYAKTLEKKTSLEQAGYTVISMWENDWEQINKGRSNK